MRIKCVKIGKVIRTVPDTGRAKDILPFFPYFLKSEMVRFAPSTESTDVGSRKIRVVYWVVFSSSSACCGYYRSTIIFSYENAILCKLE